MKLNNNKFSNIETIVEKNEEYEKMRGEQGGILKSRNILFGSLIWVTLGLVFAIIFSYLQFKLDIVSNIVIAAGPTGRMILIGSLIASIIFIFIGSWFVYSMPVWLVFIYYIVTTLVFGTSIGWMAALYAQEWLNGYSEFILLLLIPAGTVLLMGIIGYFKIFNFEKLWPVITLLLITILITSLTAYFLTSSWLFTILGGAGYLFYSLIIGLQIYRIKTMQENYFALQFLSSAEYFKITLILGTSLLISIFELFRYFFLLLSILKN
ncbi:MAG0110 family membrane protein [Mycoplasma phocimorsus]|uniref:Uncharacterized protein n=1 Tax=Mycoplasma phocimorsus TaxID=3045839 RepID=A0AAJ1UZC8_9MOLU|nr:hypothetical protein [Mycoplasma phocimorsus]MDJ1645598.1 hypothetical protein [Mycoplasma phocimorsus]MDJ1646110.1 hypothetical protein [Mycoplasma phocimorsus]MDJ1647162.1 hypothetical protein [Mycoplasma phocimorsus]MDJ1647682.1 hypothetical protein [Mycoplasma phocimorsus]MDJ1648220.1 hypothetical protein [Mycoplasma phocimorsus]